MIPSCVGADATRPGPEIAVRLESRSILVDAPECFHSQILGDACVADDADNPGVNFPLMLPEQHLESFEVARRKPFQQFHRWSLHLNTGYEQPRLQNVLGPHWEIVKERIAARKFDGSYGSDKPGI